jgi:hypothetical protein
MLRITREEGSDSRATLRLEGGVVAEWAALLERECSDLLGSSEAVSLDLAGVRLVDRAGIEALERLSLAGVEIRCLAGPVASATTTRTAEPWRGRVIIVTTPPSDDEAEQVGIVQATGTDLELAEVVDGFAYKVAHIGGNVGVVDSVRTRFEMVTTIQTYTYGYGGSKSCTGVRPVTRERGTTTVIGRAFRR